MPQFEPSLGQIAYGTSWSAFSLPKYADALFSSLLNEIDRVYWNREQKDWEKHDDPEIPGITYRPYWWGADDAPEVELPNFVLNARPDVEIRWYKWPGRGQSCNKEMTPDEWIAWFDACLATIRDADKE